MFAHKLCNVLMASGAGVPPTSKEDEFEEFDEENWAITNKEDPELWDFAWDTDEVNSASCVRHRSAIPGSDAAYANTRSTRRSLPSCKQRLRRTLLVLRCPRERLRLQRSRGNSFWTF